MYFTKFYFLEFVTVLCGKKRTSPNATETNTATRNTSKKKSKKKKSSDPTSTTGQTKTKDKILPENDNVVHDNNKNDDDITNKATQVSKT